jgi:VWFA-related protein
MMRAGVMSAALAAAWCVAVTASGPRQVAPVPPPATDPPAAVFKSTSDLVVLHVNVFAGRSDAVENLPQSAFTVLEDDRPQEITFFNSTDVPVAVGLAIDNSGSMVSRRAMVIAGANAFAQSSHPEDDLFTIVFNEHVRHGLPDGVRYTRSRAQLVSGLSRYPAGGKTAFYDAVIASLDYLKDAPLQKRVLIVLSDGGDNASQHTRQEMLDAAAASDALIYTVAKRDNGGPEDDGDPGVMRKLAEVSGGVAYFPNTEQQVIDSFTEIAGNIRRGYSIGYAPSAAADGRYHRVKVIVQAPGRKNLSAHVRHGYTARRSDGTE